MNQFHNGFHINEIIFINLFVIFFRTKINIERARLNEIGPNSMYKYSSLYIAANLI